MSPSPSPAWDLDLLLAAFRESAGAWGALYAVAPLDRRRADQIAAYNATALEALLAKGPAGRAALLALLEAAPGPPFRAPDVVCLVRDLPDEGLRFGAVGAIARVHAVRDFVAYEVAFLRPAPDGGPIAATIAEVDLRLVRLYRT